MRFSTKHLLTSLSTLLIAAPTNAQVKNPAPAKYGTLEFQTTGNVTRVTINNGPINIINPNLISDLLAYLVSIQPSSTAATPKVVIFDSKNPDWFLGPLDTDLTSAPITPAKISSTIQYSYLAPLLLNITTTAFIAEINGRSIGGGHELTLQMDMRFAGPNAHTGFFENGLGLTVGGGGQLFLGLLIGKGRALEHLLGAKAFDGPTGAAIGLFNEFYPTGQALKTAVNSLAQRIGLFPQDALNDTKSALGNYLDPSPALLAQDVTNFLALNGGIESQVLQAKFLALSKNETNGPFEQNLPEDITELYQ